MSTPPARIAAPLEARPTPAAFRLAAAACRLRTTMSASRVSVAWTRSQDSSSPDVRRPDLGAFEAIRDAVIDYWTASSLPYPEPGVRLIRRERLAGFVARMDGFRVELDDAASSFGLLDGDDPTALPRPSTLSFDFPPIEPPAHLKWLLPDLFAREQAGVETRFMQAAELAERDFADELAGLLGRPGEGDGLAGFLDRYRMLSAGSYLDLEALIGRALRHAELGEATL